MRLVLIIALLASSLLAGSWQARAQQLPTDTLLFSTARTNAWRLPVMADEYRMSELTPAGYHLRYVGADPASSSTATAYFALNAAADYSLQVRLRVRGQAGLLWGYRNRSDAPEPDDYQILRLDLDLATPLVVLWHRSNGRWEPQFTQDVPAGFDKEAAHTLRVAREGTRARFFLDGKLLYEQPAPAAWPGPRQEIGLHVEKAGSEVWMSEALFQHHSLIRLVPGIPRHLQRERLSNGISTIGAQELLPNVSANGHWLFFTRAMGKIDVPAERNTDIFVAERGVDGAWGPARSVGEPLNSPLSNAPVQVAPDGQSLLVSGTYEANNTQRSTQGVSQATRQPNGTWSISGPYTAELNIPNAGEYCRRWIDASGTVALVAGDTKDQPDNEDLYVSVRRSDGSWPPLWSLGPTLNTPKAEQAPFLAPDGKTLYFSSNGHPGYGKADIFVSTRLDDTWTKWSEPLNLGPGVNTPGYESYFSLPASGEYAYLVSEEPGSEYYDTDIYRLRLPPSMRPAATVLVRGRVLDARTNQPIANADMRYEQLPAGKEVGHLRLGGSGGFEIALPAGQQYGFRAEAPGYLSVNENLDLTAANAYAVVSRDLLLLPLEAPAGPAATEKKITLNNVFFVRGQPTLLPGSSPELQRLAQTLRDNAALRIRLDGHTDNTGDAKDPRPNQVLSEQRVAAVSAYLVKHGIAESRLSTKGYGGSQPVAPNDTEAHKARNRRVEFVIINR